MNYIFKENSRVMKQFYDQREEFIGKEEAKDDQRQNEVKIEELEAKMGKKEEEVGELKSNLAALETVNLG